MAPADDFKLSAVAEFRPGVVPGAGELGEGGEDVELRQRRGGGAEARGSGRHLPAHLGEELPLEFGDLLFRREHLALVLLELRRGEALGVHQRLLALVVGRRSRQVRLRDFDVVAKDVVEAHLERTDAGAPALARLHLGDVLLAVAAQAAELVELGVVARADGARVGERGGRVVADGPRNQLAQVRQLIGSAVEAPQARRGERRDEAAEVRQQLERVPERHQVARRGCFERALAQQPLEVIAAAENLPQLLPGHGLPRQFLDRVQARGDLLERHRGPQQPRLEQAPAGGGDRLVERGQQRGRAVVAEERLEQLQVVDGNGVEDQGLVLLIERRPAQVGQGAALGFAQVVDEGPGGAGGKLLAPQPEAVERHDTELFAQQPLGLVGREQPVFERRLDERSRQGVPRLRPAQLDLLRPQQLPRSQVVQLFAYAVEPLRAGKFGGAEFAGGEVGVGQPGHLPRRVG